jgi:hypothetical protein
MKWIERCNYHNISLATISLLADEGLIERVEA